MIVGTTVSNSQVNILGFFFYKKHSFQFVGNEGIYSVDKDLVKQNITFSQIETFVDPSQVGLTHETIAKMTAWHDSSSSSHVLYT